MPDQAGEMIERVARAIAGHSGDRWENYRGEARAAILAMREPTREMWATGGTAIVGRTRAHHDVVLRRVWQAMIDAALGEP